MPVTGLPRILEGLINSILQESELVSYKIAGYQERTTLVLRFDAMAETSVSPIHRSTPASFRRKSPSQIKRDRERQQERNLISRQEHTLAPQTNCVDAVWLKATDHASMKSKDSAVHSLSVSESNCTSSMQAVITESNNNVDEPQENADNNNLDKQHQRIDQKIASLSEDDNESINTNSLHQLSDLKRKQASEKQHKDTERQESCESESEQHTDNDTPEESDSGNTDHNSEDSADSDTETTEKETGPKCSLNERQCDNESGVNKDAGIDLKERMKSFRFPDRVMLQIFDLKRDTKKKIIQAERNNRPIKLFLDEYHDLKKSLIVVTDDLIVEYCMLEDSIINFFSKTDDADTPYKRMRIRHVTTWTDNTSAIDETIGDKRKQYLLAQLHLLKKTIKPHAQY